jgi:hypothetical protein
MTIQMVKGDGDRRHPAKQVLRFAQDDRRQAVGGPFANGIAKAGSMTARGHAAIPSSATVAIAAGSDATIGAEGAAALAQVPRHVQLWFSEC